MEITKEKVSNSCFILVSIGLYLFITILHISPPEAVAAWSTPSEIISGTWGSGENQFGIMYQDTSDMFPRFTITSDGKIVVRDGINRRLKVYTSIGSFDAIVPYRVGRHYTELTLADSYGFSGDFVGYGKDGINYFRRPDQKIYIHFSPTGELLKTTTKRPLELGWLTDKSLPSGRYKSTIRFPDITYQIISSQPIVRYYRDSRKYLHQVDSFTETVNDDDEITAYRIHTYSTCGKEISVFNMPKSQYEPMPPEAENYPTWKSVPIMEYGEPIISSNGDAYCWARTSTEYKILKWTWQDAPNPPANIPDAPINMTISPSPTALNLTWKPPLQDPGCVTEYEIARSTVSGGSYSAIGTVTNGVFNYSDTSAEAGTTYYYRVRAVGGDGYSEYSNTVSGQR